MKSFYTQWPVAAINKQHALAKRVFLILLSLSCACLYSAAQDNKNCDATFTYQVDGYAVKFVSLPSDHTQRHQWLFGDGQSADDANPVHIYTVGGTYTVLHIVKDSIADCMDSVSIEITLKEVNCTIEPKFEWFDSTSCKSIRFINQSVPISPNVHFVWKFGDGTTSTDINPVHEFAERGTYTVCLVIEVVGSDCRKEICKTIEVTCDSCRLEADFDYQNDPAGSSTFYFKSSVQTPVTSLPHYKWTFGDGSYSDDANVSHTYNAPGKYLVCLRVAISNTCVREICKEVVIERRDSCLLAATFEYRKDSTHCKLVRFINQSVPISPNVHFVWKFGDGTTSTDINPVHEFPERGNYTVCLVIEVVGSDCRKEICKTIEVTCDSCRLEADFDYQNDPAGSSTFYFKSSVQTPVTSLPHYKWTFGDGSYSDDANVSHTYNAPGKYLVCLRVAISNTCVREICKEVVVEGRDSCHLATKFEYRIDSLQKNKVHFINHTTGNRDVIHYVWKFGDGSTSNDFNSDHIFNHSGVYNVCLVAETNDGCRSEFCATIQIGEVEPECDIVARFEWRKDESNLKKIWFANVSAPVSHIWRTQWTYGDGTSSQDFNSFHEYAAEGKYQVCLKVTSLTGCSRTYCDSVGVRATNNCEETHLRFEYKHNSDRPNEISFISVSDRAIKKQKWTITRDSSVNGSPYVVVLDQNDPTYIFPFVGTYSVCLVATYENGCVKEYCERLSIGEVVNGAVTLMPVPLYPNPARSTVRMDIRLDRAGPVRVSVMSMNGVEKLRMYINGQTGNNTITIPVSKLSQGQYLVQLVVGNQVRLAKFLRM